MENRLTAQQLKNSILQMAVQGKLVPQDPNDEPASVLLEKIKKEKEQLIKEGKIKKNKKESYIFRGADNLHYEQIGKDVRCIEDELPFEIPNSWEWKSWGDISFKIQYGFNAPAKQSGKIKMVRISDIQDNSVNWNSVPYCDIEDSLIDDYLLHNNDILFARTGGTVGKSFLVENINEDAIYAGYLIRTVFDAKKLNPQYLKYFMESELYWSQLKNGTIATAQPNCNGQTLSKMLLPVPPLKEQNRIVIKIKEIELLLKKYKIVEAQLYELNSNIKEKLKKSILQYAIEGKLVPQDPNDEPASVLLERIREEKQKLIAEGKIKKDKNESIIYRRDNSYYEKLNGIERCIEEEIPYIIPDSWEWIRLGSALINRDSERIPLSVFERAKLEKKYDYYGASGVIDKVDKYLFDKPLLLVGEDGANLLLRSKPIAFIANGKYWVNNHAHVLESCSDLLLEYVEIYINSLNLSPYVTGTAQPKMNQEKMNSILIPIPPYNEQNRIITESKKIYSILK